MRPSAARLLADCCSPPSQLSSLFQLYSPWCADRRNLKTWLQRIRQDFMTKQLETSVAIEQGTSVTVPQKPAPRSNGKRLLWFLVIPSLLACSPLVTAYPRPPLNQRLSPTTTPLSLQNLNL